MPVLHIQVVPMAANEMLCCVGKDLRCARVPQTCFQGVAESDQDVMETSR